MASTSTFASTISLLKENVKVKFSSKDQAARKAAAETTLVYEQDRKETTSSPTPKKDYNARARTAEAYMIIAATK